MQMPCHVASNRFCNLGLNYGIGVEVRTACFPAGKAYPCNYVRNSGVRSTQADAPWRFFIIGMIRNLSSNAIPPRKMKINAVRP